MAKNKLKDLNDHLFAQLERLGDEELMQQNAEVEIAKAKQIAALAGKIIDIAKVTLEATIFATENIGNTDKLPELFQSPNK